MKTFGSFIFAGWLCLALVPSACAEKVTIVYTGQSYASLYPCDCPHNPEGGVARRATVIKELRSEEKNLLVVEAGGSVGSGPDDDNTRGKDSDQRRTARYLEALKAMGYDALLLSRQDLAFGEDFLKKAQAPAFVSSNTTGLAVPYVVKALGSLKVGVIGLTDRPLQSPGSFWGPASEALKDTLAALKKQKVGLVVVLSAVTPSEDGDFVRQITDLPVVVINGRPSYGSVSLVQMDEALTTTTWWQARKVGVLTVDVVGGKIKEKKAFSRTLGPDVADDPAIARIIPPCFRDSDCPRKESSLAQCLDAGSNEARCVYTPQEEAPIVSVIVPSGLCRTCRPDQVLATFEQKFGKVRVGLLKESDPAAQALIKELKIAMLPAFVFDKLLERHPNFPSVKELMEIGPSHAMLKPGVAGVSYFLGRPRIAKRLDLFFDFGYADRAGLFSLLKEFQAQHPDWDVRLNYLAFRDKDQRLAARGGGEEILEFKRAACLAQMYPAAAVDYLICRGAQHHAAWWELCVTPPGMDAASIDRCAHSSEGEKNFLDHFRLTEELQVASGPTFLVENVEVFGIVKVPSLEEFERSVTGGPGAGEGGA